MNDNSDTKRLDSDHPHDLVNQPRLISRGRYWPLMPAERHVGVNAMPALCPASWKARLFGLGQVRSSAALDATRSSGPHIATREFLAQLAARMQGRSRAFGLDWRTLWHVTTPAVAR